MPFEIIRNDITNMHVDAIVNTANPRPVIGSGVDAAIHAKAGPMLLAARKMIGTMNTGEACVTPGFKLPCKHVIHTVGPVWENGGHGEAYLLRQCYEHSLKLALRHRCKSIAFPLISSGNYGFPKRLALLIAVEAIREFLKEHEMQIYLVVFNKTSLELSEGLVDKVRSFIDDAYVQEREKVEYSFSTSRDFDFVWDKLEESKNQPIEPKIIPRTQVPTQLPPEWQMTEDDLSRGTFHITFNLDDADEEIRQKKKQNTSAILDLNTAKRESAEREKMASTAPLPLLDEIPVHSATPREETPVTAQRRFGAPKPRIKRQAKAPLQDRANRG